MVYIRPSMPVTAPSAVKPVGDSAHEPQEHSLAGDSIVNEYVAKPEADRRKQPDRRQQRKDALLETRSSRDRRKNNSISISI